MRKYILFVIGDLRRIISGVINLVRCSVSNENIGVSLSTFSTASFRTEIGKECRYGVSIANNSAQGLWSILLIDIYLKENQKHPEGHYAYYEKRVYLRGRESQNIEIIYNWKTPPLFKIEGAAFSPDNLWRGSLNAEGRFIIHALLKSSENAVIEHLTLLQEVTG